MDRRRTLYEQDPDRPRTSNQMYHDSVLPGCIKKDSSQNLYALDARGSQLDLGNSPKGKLYYRDEDHDDERVDDSMRRGRFDGTDEHHYNKQQRRKNKQASKPKVSCTYYISNALCVQKHSSRNFDSIDEATDHKKPEKQGTCKACCKTL